MIFICRGESIFQITDCFFFVFFSLNYWFLKILNTYTVVITGIKSDMHEIKISTS